MISLSFDNYEAPNVGTVGTMPCRYRHIQEGFSPSVNQASLLPLANSQGHLGEADVQADE